MRVVAASNNNTNLSISFAADNKKITRILHKNYNTTYYYYALL